MAYKPVKADRVMPQEVWKIALFGGNGASPHRFRSFASLKGVADRGLRVLRITWAVGQRTMVRASRRSPQQNGVSVPGERAIHIENCEGHPPLV